MMLKVVRTAFILAVVAGVGAFVKGPVVAASDEPERFMTHVRFEAMRSLRRKAIDPQVFVREEQGYRPARGGDDPSLPLYSSQGGGLGMNLGHWLGASGTASFLNGPGAPSREARFSFSGLVPFGVYSLFVSHSTTDNVEIIPFAKTTESLKAGVEGSLALTALAERPMLDGDFVWLVYHSDGAAHETRLGELGVTAHEQLVLPVQISSARTSATPLRSPSPTPSPFPTLPPKPVTMVSQSDAPRPADTPRATATVPSNPEDDDLYVPVDHVNTPAPLGQPSPRASAIQTPAATSSSMPDETPMPDTSPMPDKSPMPDESPMPDYSPMPDESPMPDYSPMSDETPIPEKTLRPGEAPKPKPSEPTF